jgi:hypothetical protein
MEMRAEVRSQRSEVIEQCEMADCHSEPILAETRFVRRRRWRSSRDWFQAAKNLGDSLRYSILAAEVLRD